MSLFQFCGVITSFWLLVSCIILGILVYAIYTKTRNGPIRVGTEEVTAQWVCLRIFWKFSKTNLYLVYALRISPALTWCEIEPLTFCIMLCSSLATALPLPYRCHIEGNEFRAQIQNVISLTRRNCLSKCKCSLIPGLLQRQDESGLNSLHAKPGYQY